MKRFAGSLALFSLLAFPAFADPAGDALAKRIYDRNDGKTQYSEVELVLENKKGEKRPRSLVMAIKELPDKRTNRYVRFTAPTDIKGTGFLSLENKGRADDQHLFLPALRSVRRISADQKDRRFVGTDLSYEDLEVWRPEKYSHKVLRKEEMNGHPCEVLESIPKKKDDSQYGKLITWVASEKDLPVRVDYFDAKGTLVKRYDVSKVEKIQDIWTVMIFKMQDFREKHTTHWRVEKVKYNEDVSDRMFTQQYLGEPPD